MKRLLLTLAIILPLGAANAASLPPPGAANCSVCHQRNDGDPALPKLAGQKAADIVAAMDAFRTGKRRATVMDRIAKGFTDDEVAAIAAWYAAQK